jgi:A/G-specific adenine glycosylase
MSRDVSRLLDLPKRKAFRHVLLNWYSKYGRDLPWRRTRSPYRILVSEFMLQQTQVATALPYYKKWLRRFPSFTALARASQSSVLHQWQGLGYYRRAGNLHATAKLVTHRCRGRFPRSIEETRLLPGIGKYTAHAVATFAFDQPVPIVEANTSRVLARLFNLRKPIESAAGRKNLWSHAAALVPKKAPSIYNSALLDLGALICLPRKPNCGKCPVQKFCRAKNPELLPIKRVRPAVKKIVERHAFVTRGGKLLLTKSARRWRGMWILPPLKLKHIKDSSSIHRSVFPFTNHRITLQIFQGWPRKIDNHQRWFIFRKLRSIPIPSPHRRAIVDLLNAELARRTHRRQSSER